MAAQIFHGWLAVPYDGHDISLVEFGINEVWYPAFLNYVGATRVAVIRPPQGVELKKGQQIQLRVDGTVVKTEYFTG